MGRSGGEGVELLSKVDSLRRRYRRTKHDRTSDNIPVVKNTTATKRRTASIRHRHTPPSIPLVVSSQRMPATDLESDLDILNSMDRPSLSNGASLETNAYDEADYDNKDDGYFESHDSCNLSGI